MRRLAAVFAVMTIASPVSADLMKPTTPITIRGMITSVSGTILNVRTTTGAAVRVALAPDACVATVSTVALDAIKPNSFIGTTAVPDSKGTLRATEVHVFPESMRGTGEGHYPWDNGTTSSMTNGNVASMTNGNVGAVGNVSGAAKLLGGRTLTVDYKGGHQQIFVPSSVPIVALSPGSPTQLVVGAHIFTRALPGPNGVLTTKQVAVGVGGTVPPM